MSRSGYSDDLDNWSLIRWRGRVASAARGARGQAFFRGLVAALDAMPARRLIAEAFESDDTGEVCALGALAKQRGVPVAPYVNDYDDYDYAALGAAFDISPCLAREVMYENDEGGHWKETPEQRWERVRAWAAKNVREPGGVPEPKVEGEG
jgi:hypothetical protein